MKDLIILSDFDGTIVEEDLAAIILQNFAVGWEKYDDLLELGEITVEECMEKQYGLINAELEEMISAINHIPVRTNFLQFAQHCHENSIDLKIVSAGLDFTIHYVLSQYNLDLEVISASTTRKNNHLSLIFPRYDRSKYKDFKEAAVLKPKENGNYVIYIGDGASDFTAALQADYVFTVKNSQLAKFCFDKNLNFSDFYDFTELIQKIIQIRRDIPN